jgi:recombination protein RecA
MGKQSKIDKHIDKIIKSINKEFYPKEDQRIIQRLNASPTVPNLGVVSTGSILLDDALGVGGLPSGRIVEIYGQEGSGKTTIGLHTIAEAQKLNAQSGDGEEKYVLFVDAEHALDPQYAQAIGVDPSKLIVLQPDYAEQALQITAELVASGAINVFVIDSVAALIPKAEYEGSYEDQHVGRQARVMSQALRKMNGIMSNKNVLGIFINQVREKIGVMFGNPETTPGGRALKFWSTIRLSCTGKRIGDANQRDERAVLKVEVVKNKVAPPHKVVETEILFGYGIDKEKEIIDLGVEKEIIERSGSWYSYKDEQLGQGLDNAREFLLENPDIYNEIRSTVTSSVYNKNQEIAEEEIVENNAEDIEDNLDSKDVEIGLDEE